MNNTKLTSLAVIVIHCLRQIASYNAYKDIAGTYHQDTLDGLLDILHDLKRDADMMARYKLLAKMQYETTLITFSEADEANLSRFSDDSQKLIGFFRLLDRIPGSSENQSKDFIRIFREICDINSLVDDFEEIPTNDPEDGWTDL